MIMLAELQKVLRQELECLCSKTTTVLLESTIPKLQILVSSIFVALKV